MVWAAAKNGFVEVATSKSKFSKPIRIAARDLQTTLTAGATTIFDLNVDDATDSVLRRASKQKHLA
jgi:hypothetical protein